MYPSRRPRLDVASVASEILVSIVRCLFRIAPLLLAGLFMAGCAPSHYSKGISSFAAAAAPALDKVDASYTAVNDVHIFEEQTELVAQYDTSGYRPGQIKALISPEELETRTQAVSVLRRYSQAIGDLAAGKQAETASGSSRGAGGPYNCRSCCERQDDPIADGPHPVWTRRCAHHRLATGGTK